MRHGKCFPHIFRDPNFNMLYYCTSHNLQIWSYMYFDLFSMENLLQAIPYQPCHILAWSCSLSYTNDWALELHTIYFYFGWHLWKLDWPLPIICVQAISQELMVIKISWELYSVKGNVGNDFLCKHWQLWVIVVAECCFEVRMPFLEVTSLHCHPETDCKGSFFALEIFTYITLNTVQLSAYFYDH